MDCSVTLLCWSWFIFGFIIFYSWRYVLYFLFSKDLERHFQRLNSSFYQVFFRIVEATAPRQKLEIESEIAAIRSAVIVSNHLSYLDPLFLISLFQRHKTIVKTRFFTMPIFGWIMIKAGYIPATSEGRFARLMLEQMETMEKYLGSGGNLFVFPEGTRSRDGNIGTLHKGALKIARMYKVPIYILQIRNTDKLFTPGKFFFNTRRENTISVKLMDCINPDYQNDPPSVSQLEQRVRQAFNTGEI